MSSSPNAFHDYFSSIYGHESWEVLFAALQASDQKVARLNPFFKLTEQHAQFLQDFEMHDLMGQKYLSESDGRSFLKKTGLSENQVFYFLDLASLLPPLALDVQPGETCLDLCAAPGGKSLILASMLAKDSNSELEFITNEISQDRRSRLIRVLKEQLPEQIFRQIKITAHDAAKWCLYQKNAFDKILLDVPCSGERYLVSEPKELAAWTKKRTQGLSQRQFAILASGFEVLRPGGCLVYSTCSISPVENDDVIRKLLKKRAGRVQVEKYSSPIGTPTEFGWSILPNQNGVGPIYFSKLTRLD